MSLDSLPKVLLRRFEFEVELGTGAAGTVYRARTVERYDELPAGSEVAVKVLRADRIADPAARRQLAREGEIGTTMRSDHVVRIYHAENSRDPEQPSFLVMEYVRGRTLRAFLDEAGPIVGQLAHRIGEDAARGLHALHQRGVVHRDIKPENLLISEAGDLKLMDLGLALHGTSPTRASSDGFHGSFAYAAPEVLRGRRHTEAADLYALGAVLFEVATGRHPFAEHSGHADEMIHAHLHEVPARVSHVAPRVGTLFEVLVGELLEKHPSQRPQSALEVAQALHLGEASRYWRRREQHAPILASQRRLQAMRRPAPTDMFGREREARELDRAMREARRGHGGVVHVSGPEGIGRRRLCDDRVEHWLAGDRPPLFLGGRADRRTADLPATPLPQILRDYLLRSDTAGSPNSVARAATRATDEFGFSEADASRLAAIACGVDVELGPATRAELIVRALVSILDSHESCVLRIDKCERLDAAGALVIRALAEQARDLPLLILLAGTRPPVDEPRRVVVGGLDREEFVDFGTALFRDGEAPLAMLVEAHESLTGHPGMLLGSLDEREHDGNLQGRPGDYHGLTGVTDLRPTRTAVQRLRRRLDDLPIEKRFVLQAAAVLGREFGLDDLGALTGRPDIEVLESLASFDGRVVHTQHGRGAFAHRDLRRALLDSIEVGARRRLHRAAAWMLEDRGAAPLEVGMHLSRAGLDAECIEPLLEGLDRLVATGLRRGSVRVAERLRLHLDRLPADDERRRQRLRLFRLSATAHASLGHTDKAHSLLRSASAIAAELGDREQKAEALIGLAEIAQDGGRFLTAMHLLEDVENVLGSPIEPESGEARAAARAFGLHSRVLAYQGHVEGALTLARRARDLAPIDDPILRAHLQTDLGRWRALHTHFAAADESFARAATLAAESGDVASRMRVLLHSGRMHTWLGAREDGEEAILECAELARRVDDARMLCRADLFLGEIRALSGQPELEVLDRARAAAIRVSDRVTASLANALRVLAGADDDVEHDEDVGVPFVAMVWCLAHATAARRAGDHERAREQVETAVRYDQDLRAPLPFRVVLLRAAGRESAARRLPENVAGRLPPGFSKRRFLRRAARWRIG